MTAEPSHTRTPDRPPTSSGQALIHQWFTTRDWHPFPFQTEAWHAYAAGFDGLIHAPTGTGKTYAAWLGPLIHWLDANPDRATWPAEPLPLRVLWITPLRALANDTFATLQAPVADLALPWSVELRTGDTSSSVKQRQRKALPTALITTPESLTLMLSYPDSRPLFNDLQAVVVDEWHELLGTKRGIQTELALARLRRWRPDLQTWGLSATLDNLHEALDVLAPSKPAAERVLISADMHKSVQIDTIIPPDIERFPWAGHLGLKLLPEVAAAIRAARTTLVFTNTRAQTEIWFQALVNDYPEFAGEIALHHGSLEFGLRQEIEARLRDARLRCVVCTSSLDLGVDFSPVDQVVQVGSPKGVARLLQRAGRSGHQPGASSRILCVPTHAFELVEFAAVRQAIDARDIEGRVPLTAPLDVLIQHLVTMAMGGGYRAAELYDEVRSTHAYRHLADSEWQWAMDFVTHGGTALRAYDQYRKIAERDGIYRVSTSQIARYHRMSIGTITADAMLTVKYVTSGTLGSVEESFIARMRPGDTFVFAGRVLELVRVKDLTAYVRRATRTRGVVPRWNGGRMPLSTRLARAVGEQLEAAANGEITSDELRAIMPILSIQARWSCIPIPDCLVVEQIKSRDGYHHFAFPMAGRTIHEGLSTLMAYRLTQQTPRTVSAFATDYGFELLSEEPLDLTEGDWYNLLTTDNLVDDILACLNTTELARRQFRDIARIAGLIFSGYPGSKKSTRQLQTSSGLLFDVFNEFDPDNMLLDQARREVLEQQLSLQTLRGKMEELLQQDIIITTPPRMTPFAFPIWTDRLRTQVSSESWTDRVQRMVLMLEDAADE